MFNKRLSEIVLSDVENFCREWREGIRVEYKSQFIADGADSAARRVKITNMTSSRPRSTNVV